MQLIRGFAGLDRCLVVSTITVGTTTNRNDVNQTSTSVRSENRVWRGERYRVASADGRVKKRNGIVAGLNTSFVWTTATRNASKKGMLAMINIGTVAQCNPKRVYFKPTPNPGFHLQQVTRIEYDLSTHELANCFRMEMFELFVVG